MATEIKNTPSESLPSVSEQPTKIIPTPVNIPQVFDPEADIDRAKKAANALMQVIEATKPLKMNGKTYLYFEHWQTIAKFFNASVGIEWTHELVKDNKLYGYEAKSLLYQNGTVIGGAEASCNRDEANWKSKPDFQLKSMAQTRAMAKALRSVFGYVAVLAGVEATPAEELGSETQNSAITSKQYEPTPQSSSSDYEKLLKQINDCEDDQQLTQVAENLKFFRKQIGSYYYGKLLEAGKKKRETFTIQIDQPLEVTKEDMPQ